MDIGVLPAIAEVALIGIKDNQSSFVKNPEALRWFAVVLVDFRQTVREIVKTMEYLVVEREFHELFIGEYFFDFPTKRRIHTVVVVGVKETAAGQVSSQSFAFFFGKTDVAVAGHINIGIVEKIVVGRFDIFTGINCRNAGVVFYEFDKVRQRRWIGIPVSSTAVFKLRNGKRDIGYRVFGKKRARKESKIQDNRFIFLLDKQNYPRFSRV